MAVARLAGEELAGRDDAELAGDVVEIRAAMDALESEWLRRLRAVDQRRAVSGRARKSTAGWLRHACRLAPRAAHGRVELARRLPALPATESALRAGAISVPHGVQVAAIVDDVAQAAGPAVAAAAEELLVEVARQVDPARLQRESAHVRHQFAPAAAHQDAERVWRRRRLSVSETFDGMVAVDGLLDPEGGALVLSALAPLSTRCGPNDARTSAQRRADGLVELAHRQLGAGDLAGSGGERPHLTVMVGLETLEQRAGARAAETAWAGPLCGAAARRLACDAAVTRVITSGASQPLDVGRRSRTVPPAIRTALTVRDRGCVFPHCGRPSAWTDAHHVTHWADGGATALENLVLLCRTHHRAVHEGGWRPVRQQGGRWTVQPPGRAGPAEPPAA
jgi:Domain of unknown function (DUF222)/HNH endonuclease